MTHPQDTTPANPAQVTDAMVEAGHNGLEEWRRLYVNKDEIRAILTAAIGAGGQAVALPPITDRGLQGQIMDAAWPEFGGDMQTAEFWNDFGAGVEFTLKALTHSVPSGQAVAAVELGGKAIRGSQIATETQGLLRDPLQNYVAIEDAFSALSAIAHPVQPVWRSQAANDVLSERQRQVEAEGWTAEHDNEHRKGELLSAAKAYFAHAIGRALEYSTDEWAGVPDIWPWEPKWWKPKSPRQDLVRAGALALAEIDRVKRTWAKRVEHRYLDAEVYYASIIAEIDRLDRLPAAPQPKGE